MGDVVDFLREGEPRAREEKYQNLLIFQSINLNMVRFPKK